MRVHFDIQINCRTQFANFANHCKWFHNADGIGKTQTPRAGKLRGNADALKGMGATSLYLFGSVAQDEASADSEIDLFIDYDTSRRFSLIDLVGIKHFLEEQTDMEIDLTTRDSLHPMLKQGIENSAYRIF